MGLCLRRLRLQYPLQGWQGSSGISGSFQAESVATFDWNRWQVSTGISGNLRAEYAVRVKIAPTAKRCFDLFPLLLVLNNRGEESNRLIIPQQGARFFCCLDLFHKVKKIGHIADIN